MHQNDQEAGRGATRPIQSLDRGIELLEIVGRASEPVGVPELTRALGIDRSSVFRLANTLRLRGFLAHPAGSKAYILGSALPRLAENMPWRRTLAQVGTPALRALAERTGETAHLAVREGTRAVFVGHARTSRPVGVDGRSGHDAMLHCTALGKALLCDLSTGQLAALFGPGPLEAATERTVASVDALDRECQRVRRLGYAVDDQEAYDGVRCVGAPVRDASGLVVAAVGISAPAQRLPVHRFKEVAPHVVRAASEIAEELGCKGAAHEE